jgi:hypothetical protein
MRPSRAVPRGPGGRGPGGADVRIVVGFGGGRTGADALAGSPWIETSAETAARWAELGADEIVLTARTAADIDRLVAAAAR